MVTSLPTYGEGREDKLPPGPVRAVGRFSISRKSMIFRRSPTLSANTDACMSGNLLMNMWIR